MRNQITVLPPCDLCQTEGTNAPEQIMELIDTFDSRQLEQYSNFHPIYLRHYAQIQKRWLEDSTYFLGIDLGHQPSPGEIADKILKTNHSQRFRAYYALSFPHLVTLDEDAFSHYNSVQMRLLIDA